MADLESWGTEARLCVRSVDRSIAREYVTVLNSTLLTPHQGYRYGITWGDDSWFCGSSSSVSRGALEPFAFPLAMNHSTSQRDMHSSSFGAPGMLTSASGSNPSPWSHSTSSNSYGSLSDSLNQSLNQTRPQYQAGYLMVGVRLYGAQPLGN